MNELFNFEEKLINCLINFEEIENAPDPPPSLLLSRPRHQGQGTRHSWDFVQVIFSRKNDFQIKQLFEKLYFTKLLEGRARHCDFAVKATRLLLGQITLYCNFLLGPTY